MQLGTDAVVGARPHARERRDRLVNELHQICATGRGRWSRARQEAKLSFSQQDVDGRCHACSVSGTCCFADQQRWLRNKCAIVPRESNYMHAGCANRPRDNDKLGSRRRSGSVPEQVQFPQRQRPLAAHAILL